MHKVDMDKFAKELMFTGNIVQDSDDSVPWPDRENRFNRYIELLEAIDGDEGLETARIIIKSMQAEQDYGAYQTTQRVLGRFPSEIIAYAMVDELPALIRNNAEWAGELLCSFANSIGAEYEGEITLFNRLLAQTNQEERSIIVSYIKEQEKDGWLEHRKGILG